jgi:short subunit dehydrogenase-like uncharacterized protein
MKFTERKLTLFIQLLMREKRENIPPEDSLEVTRRVKEVYCYIYADIVKEFVVRIIANMMIWHKKNTKSVSETLKEIVNRWSNDKIAGQNTWQQSTTATVARMTTVKRFMC